MELSWTHVHLLLNYFPIIGTIFVFLLLIYALLKDSAELKQTIYWGFIIIALITIPVFYAGMQAEEVVEKLPRVSHSLIHAHRQIAEQAFIVLEILGAISLFGLGFLQRKKKTPSWFTATLVIVTIIATGLVSWTGLQGGIIRHTEVRGELGFLLTPEETGEHTHEGSETNEGQTPEHSSESGHSHE